MCILSTERSLDGVEQMGSDQIGRIGGELGVGEVGGSEAMRSDSCSAQIESRKRTEMIPLVHTESRASRRRHVPVRNGIDVDSSG